MTIVVTGATGQLGQLTVRELLSRGAAASDILATGRSAEKLAAVGALGVRTARVDYTDPSTLDAAFAGADVVLFISGSEVGQRVDQHTAVVDAAVRTGVGHIAYTSAPHADSTDLVLAPEHKATEQALAASGLGVTVLRNNWYHENYGQALAQASQTGVYLASTGSGRVASAARADYAAALAVVATQPQTRGRIYELGGDVAWDGDEFAAAATEALGRPVTYRSVSSQEHTQILTAAGLPEQLIGFLVALDANIAAGDLGDATGELSALIGRPTTPLVDGLKALAAQITDR